MNKLFLIASIFFAMHSCKLAESKAIEVDSVQMDTLNCLTVFDVPLIGDSENEVIGKFVAGMPEMKLV